MKRFIAMMMAVVTMMSVCVSASAATASSYDKNNMNMHNLIVYTVGKNGNYCKIDSNYKTEVYAFENKGEYKIISYTNMTRYTNWGVYYEGWNEVMMLECDDNDNLKVYIAQMDKNNNVAGDYWVGTATMCYDNNCPHFTTQLKFNDNKFSDEGYEAKAALFAKFMYNNLVK